MQQIINGKRYRLFTDPGHAWLEVPRAEVVASGARISSYSYYDPVTDMAYLEEDCDIEAWLDGSSRDWAALPVVQVNSSMPRDLPRYDMEAATSPHSVTGGRA